MKGVRNFWLINNTGERYDLTNIEETVFGANPTGLGVSASIVSFRLGNSEKVSNLTWNLETISLELFFKFGNNNAVPYDQYKRFMSFISKLPLYLYYKTPDILDDSKSRYREVVLESISKEEINREYSTLICPINLKPLTLWFDNEVNIVEVEAGSAIGKSYPLRRPYAYSAPNTSNVVLNNTSDMTIPFIIEILGECTDPQYNLFDNNGDLYGIGRFEGTFDYVYVNSTDLDEEIKLKVGASFLPNPTSYQDLTLGVPNQVYVTFIYLRPGISTMTYLFDNAFDGKVRISWRSTYVS